MKIRLLLLTGVLALSLALLAGCGGQEAAPAEPEPEEAVTETEETAEPEEAPETAGEVAVEEAVLYEEGGVTIRLTGVEPDYEEGPAFLMTFDNQTEKELYISTENASLNGFQMDAYLNDLGDSFYSGRITLEPGASMDGRLYFETESVTAAGIETLGTAEFSLEFEEYETWDELGTTDPITIQTNLAEQADGISSADGAVLYDGDGIVIAAMGVPAEAVDEVLNIYYPALLYLENNTGTELDFMVVDAVVNGTGVSAVLDDPDLLPGKKAVTPVMMLGDQLAEAGIDAIESLTLTFLIDGDDGTLIDIDTPLSVLP